MTHVTLETHITRGDPKIAQGRPTDIAPGTGGIRVGMGTIVREIMGTLENTRTQENSEKKDQ